MSEERKSYFGKLDLGEAWRVQMRINGVLEVLKLFKSAGACFACNYRMGCLHKTFLYPHVINNEWLMLMQIIIEKHGWVV